MKKLTLTISILLLSLITGVSLVMAADPPAGGGGTAGGAGGATGSTPAAGGNSSGAATMDQLFPRFEYKTSNNQGVDTSATKIAAVQKLPQGTWQAALAAVVKILLNITGAIALLAFTLGGVYMITARGNPAQLDKGKKIVAYAIAGLVVIAVSYAVVVGVSELQIFQPGTASQGSTTGSSSTPAAITPAQGTGGAGSTTDTGPNAS
ncbi:hypothetical protein IT411_03050 [Candidatus Peregrinibacteria bacterium]|nr:hypothetical protein [Candidatus Peregrinibacteria bacterium]